MHKPMLSKQAMNIASTERNNLGDLNKKSKAELMELLERQRKLLDNRKFIASLPDKGEKIIKFKNELEKLLDQRKVATEMFTEHHLSNKLLSLSIIDEDNEIGEDKSEPSVWETLATNGIPQKIISYETLNSLGSTDSQNSNPTLKRNVEENVFYNHLAQAVDKVKAEERILKLNRTSPSSRQKSKINEHKQSRVEENSAVRYPMGPHKETKVLSLQESLQLQKQHMEQLQEVQIKQAAEQLAGLRFKMGEYLPESHTNLEYRQPLDEELDSDTAVEELD